MEDQPAMTSADEQAFADAVAVANVPTLLMVLVQLTGELGWLEPPYRPSPGRGMGDNDSGGLPESVQNEVRAAAREAILAWRGGRPVAIPDPSPSLLVDMLSVAMGDHVPPEYGRFTAAQLGHRPVSHDPIALPEGFQVLVIGAGVSGICAAVNLKAAGVSFSVLEKNSTVGGTWLENRYPGAGVDTPNHLYSYSFAPYDWSMFFALRDELHAYLEYVANEHALKRHIEFDTEVLRAQYHEDRQLWKVTIRRPDGVVEVQEANVVISAIGIFNPAVYPKIDGLDTFGGPSFHTSDWPQDIDLRDQRVAIVGNGASCMQIGPEIQDVVNSLTISQRSPHWAAPFEQFRRVVPEPLRLLLREVPLYQAWYRVRLGWTFNDRVHTALQKDPTWPFKDRSLNSANDGHRAYFTQYVKAELGERADLLDKVLPTYPPFVKRMLMDNGWYRMLRNEKVELVQDSVSRIDEGGVTTENGDRYDTDVLVIATGFDVLRFITTFEATGRSGRTLREVWEDDNAKAYIGTTVPDFPNFYTLYGPNLQPGHGGSLIFVVEMQVHYIMNILKQMSVRQIGAVECREDVYERYNQVVDRAHENMVWTHEAMATYYRNARGRVVVNSPFRNVDFYDMTREADLTEFVVEPRRA